jgi:phosphatidylglycerol lysyltransferase
MDSQRQQVLQLIQRHGWNATAFQTLESGYSYFFDGSACVAYVDTGAAWVVAGAPLAASEDFARLTARLLAAAQAAGRRCCFFAVEERFVAATARVLRALLIGEQPVYDPRQWQQALASSSSLRAQLRRAATKGVSVRELVGSDAEAAPLRVAVERMAQRWLETRPMAPMGFLVKLELFGFSHYRRCFVAMAGDRVVGFAGLVPVPSRLGWLVEDLIRDPAAPNGTSELLIHSAMSWAADSGCTWLTLGLAPLSGDVPEPLQLARRSMSLLYNFEGLRAYKAKLGPRTWSKIFLAYPPTQSAWRSLLDALSAFAAGGFLAFGLRSLLRGPEVLVRALAALLVPWTALLVMAPSERWFGSAAVKWAWIAFDVTLLLGFWLLLRKPLLPIYTLLAVAVTADAFLTLLQAVIWNLPSLEGLGDAALVFVACAAPTLVSVMLWGARHRVALRQADR